ncbi:glycoside hydrolase family 15 protein [Micromonospora sp. WMMD812]|uniref:glycoside hydrolase family 15 protein n=1 Tax=Micromonospora sp. WMMD812 TaxID=3015152 RepID=UPI00248BF816|nr:glycoside hydrolase family 15 protein [Micromonospora sp. WMMD812]WBB70060.1 glycoside hydrolase family 15 protein [Micromonospora sp. WMMD812]
MSEFAIADYGLLSDCASAALVSRGGSIDWWCPGRFDAPSVFGRLLDPEAGHWALSPVAAGSGGRSERAYVDGTLVLRTVHHTGGGKVAVTEALVAEPGARGHELGRNSPAVLARVVEGLTGTVRMRCEFVPRPEYGLVTPYLHCAGGRVQVGAGPLELTLRAPVRLDCAHGRAYGEFDVVAGQVLGFDLAHAPAYGPPPRELDPVASLADTVEAWRALREMHEYDGRYADLVRRSALVVQGLTYRPSGAVVAAVTTSLPERLGGRDNYDYRYAWLRDFDVTMRALWVAACPDDTSRLFDWAARSAGRSGDEPVPIMYGVAGERDLSEYSLDHLRGYAGSRPVRVGNDAWRQRQQDVPGGVLLSAYLIRDRLGELSPESQALLVGLAEQATQWRKADAGMWEARGPGRHYLASKALCWGALDGAVKLAPMLGQRADPQRWAAIRDEIRTVVLRDGWNEQVGAYTGAIGSAELDASVLVLPFTGIVSATEPRMRATIDAIAERLTTNGLVRRWPDDPAGFVVCTFWLVECLAMAGEMERATDLFERTAARANDLGLFAEQIDPHTGAHVGNTPLALSHAGLIGAAWRLTTPSFR